MLLSKRHFSAAHNMVKEASYYVAWPALLVAIWPLLNPVPPAISVTHLIVVPPPSSIAIAPERPEAPRLYRL